MNEIIEILTLGPRELPALLKTEKLWKVEALYWVYYLFRFYSFDIWLQRREVPRPPEDFRFGETPYRTGLKLLEMVKAGPTDVLYDLGAGRGKLVFLAALATGGRAIGLEMLASYTLIGNRMVRNLRLEGRVEFRHSDFLEADLGEATILFTAGTSWAATTKERLLERADELAAGTRWISVGCEQRHPRLDLVAADRLLFSWGFDNAFIYVVKD